MESSVLMRKTLVKFDWGHPNDGAKYRWGRFRSAIFDQCLAISQKRCKRCQLSSIYDRRQFSAVYAMACVRVSVCPSQVSILTKG